MSGALWIASYFALSALVVFLVLAVSALYRMLAGGRSEGHPSFLLWPLAAVAPGDPVPPALRRADRQERELLVVALNEDALTTAASVAVVADELRVPWRLLIAAEAERRHLPRQLGDHAEELTAEQISAIGAIGPSVTVVVRGNHVVDAAAGVLGPSQVASLAVRGYRLEDPIGRAEDAELKAVI